MLSLLIEVEVFPSIHFPVVQAPHYCHVSPQQSFHPLHAILETERKLTNFVYEGKQFRFCVKLAKMQDSSYAVKHG